MMILSASLHDLNQDSEILDRAKQLFQAIQPLKDKIKGNYRTPEEMEGAGATTQDYSTLASQNYLCIALLLMFEQSQERQYLDEARTVLGFIHNYLYDPEQDRILHHWIDGRPALPIDKLYFCTGCNFQTLYILWYLLEKI
jgi:hypothetical protein